ncbi:MAG TPA: cation diffusion facilitator family transporter [Gammaproteobacteria bacterium]|nr:cation diffusion facilitator family transporter [Gammaproteobacteria bacterium]
MTELDATEIREAAPSRKPFYAAFAGNVVIAAAKFVAAFVTGSSAMMAEGFHSTVDATNNVLMLFGIRRSSRAPTAEHPFGFGKELYFWSLIVAVVIFGIGGGVSIYEGGVRLVHPEPLGEPIWNYGVLLISLLADGATLVFAYREFRPHQGRRGIWQGIRKSKDPTKFTVVLEDGAATIGIVIAAAGVALTQWTHEPRYDAAASVLIGLLLCTIALILAVESKGLLLGESAAEETIEAIRRIVEQDADVVGVRNILTMHLGPAELLLNLDVQFDQELGFAEIAKAIERLESAIRRGHAEVKQIFIEARALRR